MTYQSPFACIENCAQSQCRNRTTGCQGECQVRVERAAIVKRLRDMLDHEAADRIEELEAKVAALQPTEQPEDERERFEACFQSDDELMRILPIDPSCKPIAWRGWQAAKRDAAQAPQERAVVTDAEILQWAKYIVRHPEKDHACEECGGTMIFEGFRCVFHKASAMLSLAQSKDKS